MSILFTPIETTDGLRDLESSWAALALEGGEGALSVSYTHLTLPTKRIV